MFNLKTWILTVLSVATLLACGPMTARKEIEGQNPVRTHKADLADLAIDQGETLLAPETFSKARLKFKEGLEIDPENARGRFYLSLVDLLLEFQGFYSRIEPAVKSFPNGEMRFVRILANGRESLTPLVFAYFNKKRLDRIETADELTEWMDRVRLRLDGFRKTLKAIRDHEFSIRIPPGIVAARDGSVDGRCLPLRFGPVQYMPSGDLCFGAGSTTIGLGRLDFDSLYGIATNYQLELDLYTAWRVNPEAIIGTFEEPIRTKAQAEFFVKRLFSAGRDGSLRNVQPFSSFREMGADLFIALRTLIQNQREDCHYTDMNPKNRPGYMFNVGICFSRRSGDSNIDRILTMLEAIAGGRPFTNEIGFEFDTMAIIEKLPRNAKDFLPLKLNRCGRLVGVNTESLRSIMPGKGRDQFFSIQNECEEVQ